MPVLTPEESFLSSAPTPRRDDGDGRDDIYGATPGVKNIVTIDTIVTLALNTDLSSCHRDSVCFRNGYHNH